MLKLRSVDCTVTIGDVTREFRTSLNVFGSVVFYQDPCAVVRIDADSPEVIARLHICRNYQKPPTLGATINHDLYRDVILVRWPSEDDWIKHSTP